MNKNVVCPVCKEKNLETDKICKNEKCKWDLTYAKDGAFIGLSENELIDYNTKLQQAKKDYENQIIKINEVVYELKDLFKDEFESTSNFSNRIQSYGYIKIGKYKLLDYNANTEYYKIIVKIEKKETQYLEYEFDKLNEFKIPKNIAKKLKENGSEYNLFAKLKYDSDSKYKIDYIKFDGCNIEINEHESLKVIAKQTFNILSIIFIVIGFIFVVFGNIVAFIIEFFSAPKNK